MLTARHAQPLPVGNNRGSSVPTAGRGQTRALDDRRYVGHHGGRRPWREVLRRLADRAAPLHNPLAQIGEVLLASTLARFNQGVAPARSLWAALALSTLTRKKGPGNLRQNRHLQGSIRYPVTGEE